MPTFACIEMLYRQIGLQVTAKLSIATSSTHQLLSHECGVRRLAITAADGTVVLGPFAIVCIVFIIAGVYRLASTKGDASELSPVSSPDKGSEDVMAEDSGEWVCSFCQEANPGNFYTCWNCQHGRP